MNWFARFLAVACFLGLAGGPLLAGDTKDSTKKKKPKKQGSGELNIPIPVGHGAQGVHIPYYDEKGKLQMIFTIVSATRADETHLQMDAVNIETYNADGSREMSVDAKASVLDLNTKVVTSNEPATIRRSDFEITGETMQFNTKTHDGSMSGNIKMRVYNNPSSEAAAHE